jgi:hypothetical protein
MNEPYVGLVFMAIGLWWVVQGLNEDTGLMVVTPLNELVDKDGCPVYAVAGYTTISKLINTKDYFYGRPYLPA